MSPPPVPELGAWGFLPLWLTSCAEPAELPKEGWHPGAPIPVAAMSPVGHAGWTAAVLEETEFWYRCTLLSDGPGILRCNGLATIAEVWVGGLRMLQSDNMFLRHDIVLPAASGSRSVHVCFRRTGAALRGRKVDRARWRPRLAAPPGLRAVRTSLLGRMAGWCPPIPCVGPWRPITWLDGAPSSPPVLLHADLRTSLCAGRGQVDAELTFAADLRAGIEVELSVGGQTGRLVQVGAASAAGSLSVQSPAPWWPHTHGAPNLHEAKVRVGETVLPLGRLGFRTIVADLGDDRRGFGLVVNGVAVFSRGACWTGADLARMPWSEAALRPWLEAARDAGMNMLRVGGTMAYEADAFFALCDELGIMVWQDLMLANFDYPEHDPAFQQSLQAEVEQLLRRTAGHPCLAVLCGGSEVMQQAAMLGLPSTVWWQALYHATIPDLVRRCRADLVYVENSPSGGALPFCTDSGVTHYYGVGAYLRPLDDARRADVRFASECLAFANVPTTAALGRHLPGVVTTDPRWKATVPRDPGAGWDFEDVRDHYLKLLFAVDPSSLRHVDLARYLDLSRATGCLVAERVFAEWRRQGSACAGGLVWQLQDFAPGAGWGVLDSDGQPKPVWHALRRAFRPCQLVLTDEGLNGLALHVVNEAAACLEATIRLVCLRDGEIPVRSVERRVSVPGRTTDRLGSQELLPEFFDINGAYRFGPRTHDVVSASLWHEPAGGPSVLLAYDHHVLAWTPPVQDLGLQAVADHSNGRWELQVTTRRFAQFCHFDLTDHVAEDDWFNLSPDTCRRIALRPRSAVERQPSGEVLALNLQGSVRVLLRP